MQVVGYSPDELKHRIINDILIEAQTRRPEFSTDEVVQRACGQTATTAKEIARRHGMLS